MRRCNDVTRPEDPLNLTSETVGKPKLAGAAAVPGTDSLVEYKTVHGELASRGPTTMLGYWNQPEQTAATLRDGWFTPVILAGFVMTGTSR